VFDQISNAIKSRALRMSASDSNQNLIKPISLGLTAVAKIDLVTGSYDQISTFEWTAVTL